MLPHSFLWGHLAQIQSIRSQLPSDAHITNLMSKISEQFPDSDSIYYMDLWPFIPPLLILSSPNTAAQAIKQHSLRKPPVLAEIFRPITGGNTLVFMNDEEWKKSRSIFNPGFSPNYLATQIPAIVEEVISFKETLREACQQGKIFQLDPVTLNLTLDVIVRTTL